MSHWNNLITSGIPISLHADASAYLIYNTAFLFIVKEFKYWHSKLTFLRVHPISDKKEIRKISYLLYVGFLIFWTSCTLFCNATHFFPGVKKQENNINSHYNSCMPQKKLPLIFHSLVLTWNGKWNYFLLGWLNIHR